MRLVRSILIAIDIKKSLNCQVFRGCVTNSMGNRILNSTFRGYSSTATTAENNSNANSNTSSIDENEMRKFKLLAQSWWIENGEFEALHRMNMIRVPLIRDTMTSYRDGLPAKDRQKLKSYLGMCKNIMYIIRNKIGIQMN
jgi:hypothetical protein